METLWKGNGWRVSMESARLLNGRVKKAARIHRCDAVHILAFPTNETILIIREYRPFYKQWIWMLPSGKMDREKNPKAAAQRELREETGFRAGSLKKWCTANTSENIVITNHFFIARRLSKSPLKQDADERIEVHEVSIGKAIDNVLHSKVVHTPSAYALLRYWHQHNRKE